MILGELLETIKSINKRGSGGQESYSAWTVAKYISSFQSVVSKLWNKRINEMAKNVKGTNTQVDKGHYVQR